MLIVDLDDFCESNECIELLWQIKSDIPKFKVTLFTILGKCSNTFIEAVKEIKWVDMIPHGLFHTTSRECEKWDYAQSMDYLAWANTFNLTKGFKAPGWQISNDTYRALEDQKYWVADHIDNDKRRPITLKAYVLDRGNKIHGHVGHMGGHNDNELSLILPTIYKYRDLEFGFVRDAVV